MLCEKRKRKFSELLETMKKLKVSLVLKISILFSFRFPFASLHESRPGTVHMGPIWIEPDEIIIKPKKEAYLVCGLRSSTVVHFEWYFNSTLMPQEVTLERDIEISEIPPEDRGNPYKPIYKSLLRFLRISYANTGNYVCLARTIGFEQQNITAKVLVTEDSYLLNSHSWKKQKEAFLIVFGVVILSLFTGFVLIVFFTYYKAYSTATK